MLAIFDAAGEDHLGQRVLHRLLDHALQGARAVCRIPTLFREPVASAGVERDGDLAIIQEFLQALFIARRVYPLAYNKWIRMQVEDWLGLPELYRALPQLISIRNIESSELVDRASDLNDLLDRWTVDGR